MSNRIQIGSTGAALALILIAGPAFGQTVSDGQTFPIDPYASATEQAFSANPYNTDPDTDQGFSTDPFGNAADQGAGDFGAQDQNQGLRESGTTAKTGVGEVGQRQTANDIAPEQSPLDRIDNRIQNRVENRLRNRIDRNYDPTANATSPFTDANQRAQDASPPR